MFSEFRRGNTKFFAENSAEVQWIVIAYKACHFRDIMLIVFQKTLRVGQPDRLEILRGCKTGVFFKTSDEPARTHSMLSGIIFDQNIFLIILLKIFNSCLQFKSKSMICFFVFLKQKAMYFNKNQCEIEGKNL